MCLAANQYYISHTEPNTEHFRVHGVYAVYIKKSAAHALGCQ